MAALSSKHKGMPSFGQVIARVGDPTKKSAVAIKSAFDIPHCIVQNPLM
jgi:hypothetical protein